MTLLIDLFTTALRQLWRGRQRNLVALACIVFGVMSLVAMTLLSESIERTTLLQPNEMLGGDASLGRKSENTISQENIDQLARLQQSGLIQRYSLMSFSSSIMFHLPGSGEMHFANTGMGIDPAGYPLAGSLTIGQPGNTGLKTLLREVGDVVITRDIADDQGLSLGSTILLSDLQTGYQLAGHIRGIASDTPNHQGSKIYYTLETAQRLSGGSPSINTALILARDMDRASAELDSTGWQVFSSAQQYNSQQDTQDLIGTMLRGAGILGLLVAGIGIANTMQVLLRRRQKEVAIWKTLGYRENDLQVMFLLEAFLLGLLGSLPGAILGVLISSRLVDVFRHTSNFLFTWQFSPIPVWLSVLVGVLTTVIFATWAIVAASRAQPMALLRNEPVDVRRMPRWQWLVLLILLTIPFIGMVSLVMGSLLHGLLVLLIALAGLVCLGGLFAGLLWVFSHLVPLRRLPLLHMAQKSLRRRGLALVFAMIALFIGILSMTLGVVVTQNGQREMDMRRINLTGANLNILAPASQLNAIQQAVRNLGSFPTSYQLKSPVQEIIPMDAASEARIEPWLVGISQLTGYTIEGAAWNSQTDGVYIEKQLQVPPGSQLQVRLADGGQQNVTVVGTYTPVNDLGYILPASRGLLMSTDYLSRLATPQSLVYSLQVPNTQLQTVTASLGQALPEATVINLVAYATRFTQIYQNLFVLAMAMSGLALLAGFLLVANSVSLAMLDRRYEIGVLKSVGYAHKHILGMLAAEYGLIACIATIAGMLAVRGYLYYLSLSNRLAGSLFNFSISTVLLVLGCGVGLTLLIVMAVTWRPTRVSPVAILNERV